MVLAFVGGAGHAILFMFAFAAAIVVGSYIFAYTAHCFLVTVEQTSAGNDEVQWPDEPFVDWLWRAVSLAWLMFVWLAPVGVVLKLTHRHIYSEEPGLALLFGGVALWLFFPIAALSSLYANSAWVFFHPRIPIELARVSGSTLVFYVVSGLVIAASLVVWFFALSRTALLIPVAAFFGAFAVLLYARLLGRLTWIVLARGGKRRRKKPRKYADEGSALPPLPPPDAAVGETTEAVAEPERVRPSGYEMYEQDEPDESSQVPATDIKDRMQRRFAGTENRVVKKGPPRSLWRGVFSYPFYEKSLGSLAWLTFGGIVFGGILKIMFGRLD